MYSGIVMIGFAELGKGPSNFGYERLCSMAVQLMSLSLEGPTSFRLYATLVYSVTSLCIERGSLI